MNSNIISKDLTALCVKEQRIIEVISRRQMSLISVFSVFQSSTQEIGEEAEEDAIFTITLRKVQLHQSASKGQRWLGVDTDSALSLYETCKVRTIKAGTLERLVEYMVSAFRGKDSTYVTIFLCTYRSFATTKQVLDLLLHRYGSPTRLVCTTSVVKSIQMSYQSKSKDIVLKYYFGRGESHKLSIELELKS